MNDQPLNASYPGISYHYCVRVAEFAVRRYGRRRLGIRDVDDLAIELASRFVRRASELETTGQRIEHPAAFLQGIALNTYREFIRSEQHEVQRRRYYLETPALTDLPEISLIEDELSPVQLRFLERLQESLRPKDQRLLDELSDPESRCRREQAARLELSPSALSMAIARFLERVDRLRREIVTDSLFDGLKTPDTLPDLFKDIVSFARTPREQLDYRLSLFEFFADALFHPHFRPEGIEDAKKEYNSALGRHLMVIVKATHHTTDHYFNARATRAICLTSRRFTKPDILSAMMAVSTCYFAEYDDIDQAMSTIFVGIHMLGDTDAACTFISRVMTHIPPDNPIHTALDRCLGR